MLALQNMTLHTAPSVSLAPAVSDEEVRMGQSVFLGLTACATFAAGLIARAAADGTGSEGTRVSAGSIYLLPSSAASVIMLARLLPERVVPERVLTTLWAMLILGLPLPRLYLASSLPIDELRSTVRAAYTHQINMLIFAVLMVGGGLHSVIMNRHSRGTKLCLGLLNYAWEFAISGTAFVRLRHDDGVAWKECRRIAAFDKCAPILLGFLVTETALHFFRKQRALSQQQLDLIAAQLSRREESLKRLESVNSKLEASKRQLHVRTVRYMQQVKQEKQLLLTGSPFRPGDMPSIYERPSAALDVHSTGATAVRSADSETQGASRTQSPLSAPRRWLFGSASGGGLLRRTSRGGTESHKAG